MALRGLMAIDWDDVFCVIYHYQSLISGILAVLAAIGGGLAVVHAAKIPIKAQAETNKRLEQRQTRYVARLLATECQRLCEFARQSEGTIATQIAANKEINDELRSRLMTDFHPIIHELEAMSLLRTDHLHSILTLHHDLQRHNFDMERTGGVFGTDAFRRQIYRRLSNIQALAHTTRSDLINYASKLQNEKKPLRLTQRLRSLIRSS